MSSLYRRSSNSIVFGTQKCSLFYLSEIKPLGLFSVKPIFFFFFEFPEKNNVKLEKNVLIRKIVLFLGFRKPY